MDTKYYAWIDLETTGIDPAIHKILEVAVLVTDEKFSLLETKGFRDVIHATTEDIALMDETVFQMHTDNGLIDECRLSRNSLHEVEERLVEYLSFLIPPKKAYIAGNSVSFDQTYIMLNMRKLEDFLHYRILNVTSIKLLLNTFRPDITYEKPESSHRALDDIRESIAQMKFYVERLFPDQL